MSNEELKAKLEKATENTELGNYDMAEQLTNEVLDALQDTTDASISLSDQSPERKGFSDSDPIPIGEGRDRGLLRAHATLELANIAFRRGSHDVPLALCEEVLVQADEWNLLPLRQKTWNLLGQVHNSIGNQNTALEYFEKVLSADKNLGDEVIVARSTGNAGNVYMRLSDFPRAMEYHEKALSAYIAHGNRRMEGGTKVNMAMVYIQLNKHDKALEYLHYALAIFEELGEKPFRLVAMGHIGSIYFRLENYTAALELNLKILAVQEELGAKSGIASCMTNIGAAYFLLRQYDLASEYHGKALAMFEELGQKPAIANALLNLGQVNHEFGRYDSALEYLLKALALQEEIVDKAGIAGSLANIGRLFANPNYEGFDAEKAEEYLLRSIAVMTEAGLNVRLAEKHRFISELYEQQNRDEEALIHYKKYHELNREVLNEEALKTAEKYKQERELAEREKEIAMEKARTDAKLTATTGLLHKVLPESIAARMIEGDEEIADYYPQVSILFADIAGFTPISADMPAFMVVRFLNFLFKEFDRIIKKHGCEKIKTIGDGYMAIAGAPDKCEDHAERITAVALEMQQPIQLPEDIRAELPEGTKLGVRIGLHTGSVVAGVIGEERFVWDVYSDAVNTAARMESHGMPDKIHVTQDFVRQLQNRFATTKNTTHGLIFEKRGEMEIKGKGTMRTFYLENRSNQ
ncbi:MAG: tetratricopeptide repeat protein [Bacteroidetes bacterium]|nr:tetratricopeptide repeat protein [Bacteroidota bacterium]